MKEKENKSLFWTNKDHKQTKIIISYSNGIQKMPLGDTGAAVVNIIITFFFFSSALYLNRHSLAFRCIQSVLCTFCESDDSTSASSIKLECVRSPCKVNAQQIRKTYVYIQKRKKKSQASEANILRNVQKDIKTTKYTLCVLYTHTHI